MRTTVSVLWFLLAVAASGQDLSSFEKFLLPAYTSHSIGGANGATFATVLECYTEVDTVVYAVEPGAPGPATFVTQPALNPICRTPGHGPARPTGRFYFVEPGGSQHFAFQYFVRSSDASGETADQMTALPVVSAPFARAARILGIPVEPIIALEDDPPRSRLLGYRYRMHLRVYDWEGDGTGEVIVQPYVENVFGNNGALRSSTLLLDQRDGSDPTFPWYGELPLEWCVPQSARVPCMTVRVRLDITSSDGATSFWPLVTVTDNKTQHVTVFAPQP